MVTADKLDELQLEPEVPELDLSWLNLDTEWGVSAEPGRKGLTLQQINKSLYGDIPATSEDNSARPRGAAPPEGAAPRMTPWVLGDATETFSESAGLLYDEAVSRQWSSATDIPWDTMDELPEDIERAMAQLCTSLTEVEFIAGDVPGKWLPRIAADHFESGLFLMSQVMDEARHTDVFRKRALANGGGLLLQGGGGGLRQILEAEDFTQMSSMLHTGPQGTSPSEQRRMIVSRSWLDVHARTSAFTSSRRSSRVHLSRKRSSTASSGCPIACVRRSNILSLVHAMATHRPSAHG